jgi:PAS domain S-box-containing protein
MKKKVKSKTGPALEMSRSDLEKRVEERTAELLKINEQLNLELERRIETENALLESEEKFRILSERSFVGFFIWQDDVFKYINPSFASMFSYTEKELLKKTLKDISTKKDWPILEGKFKRLMNGEIFSSHFQFRGKRKDRKIIYLDVHHTRINYKNHPAIIGTFIDLTHLKKTEKALKEKTAQLEDLNKNLKKCIEEEIQKNQMQEQVLMQQSK